MTTNIPEFLQNEKLRLILFGGKGGVGKTTMAAMTALYLAGISRERKKILIISTDPAHSLSDSLGIPIGDHITPVEYAPASNLFAHELDAPRLMNHFKEENHEIIGKLAERGTYFDQEDIAEFLDLSLPGMDEVMAVIEMARLLKENRFDTLIVDTAPTGHTVRMFDLPNQMKKWIAVMDLMQHKHRYLFRHFTGKKYTNDDCDLFLINLASDINRVRKMLSNRDTTRFVPVLIPELMSVHETIRLMKSLEKINVPVLEMVINRVAQGADCRNGCRDGCCDRNECPFCRSRKENQKEALQKIDAVFSRFEKIQVPLFANEINGLSALKKTADYLTGLPVSETPLKVTTSIQAPDGSVSLNSNLTFLLFGGKGGVGKTTLAAAAAIHLACRHPEKKILLFSTDPAHSLRDSFDIPIGNHITPIQGAGKDIEHDASNTNLFALEIDPEQLWFNFKETFKQDVKDLFDHFLSKGTDIRFDRQVMTEILEMAPPGLDEIMSLDKMMDLRKENQFDIFVLDTSPTGHLLRFLELPHLVREWLRVFFRLLMKYKGVVRLTGAAEKALALSKNVRQIQESLTDTQKTRFVSVTIPERMGFLELERLMDALIKANVPCEHVIVNMVLPPTDCGFCTHKHMEQQGWCQEIHSRFHSQTVVQAPLFPHPVRGMRQLKEISNIVFCGK